MNKKTAGINEDAKNLTLTSVLDEIINALHTYETRDDVVDLCHEFLAKVPSNQASDSEPVIRLLKNTRVAPDGKRWNNLYIQVRNGSPISIDLVGKTRSNWKIRNLLLAHATEFTPTWAYKAPESDTALPIVDDEDIEEAK